MGDLDANQLLFPFNEVRPIQDQLLEGMHQAIESQRGILAHAPTGLGKTVASLAPALRHAIDNDLTIYFLTSRHTQHGIAIETLRDIREKHDLDFQVADMIGKKWMCAQPGVEKLFTSEFYEYCKAVREEGKCEFYSRARSASGKLTTEAQVFVSGLKERMPLHVEETVSECRQEKYCPYEISSHVASKARVIVTDYFYLFHPTIRDSFMRRCSKSLDKAIVIVDEGHNLPGRLRELMSSRITTTMVRRAVKEVKKYRYGEVIPLLTKIQDVINSLSDRMKIGDEKVISRDAFSNALGSPSNYQETVNAMTIASEHILQEQKRSAVSGIANFLTTWGGPDKGFARILAVSKSQHMPIATLTYRCLDPSLMTVDVINQAYAVLVMSGTLTPVDMYRDLLGMDKAIIKKLPSPFPQKNRLACVVTTATTQYKQRGPAQYQRIADCCAGIANRVPGNSAIFFPSYSLRDEVHRLMQHTCEKTIFLETPKMTKEEKVDLFDRFGSYKNVGAVLLGVTSGSFSEGIDFAGDLLKGVVIVGLPLQRPDMETKCLIDYYDTKFGKGWDYGYVYPAMNRALQSAGRCIRSGTDRGVVVFLDMRYSWPKYAQCLPQDWGIETMNHETTCFKRIEGFFA